MRQLLSDDAAVFHGITDRHALCWVHDGRHYAKLSPLVSEHQRVLADFRGEYWALYRQLAAYREWPSTEERARLEEEFDQLMALRTGYDDFGRQDCQNGIQPRPAAVRAGHTQSAVAQQRYGGWRRDDGCASVM